MLPFSLLTLKPLRNHGPGSLVWAQSYLGPVPALRVEVPVARSKELAAGLLLLGDAPWSADERKEGAGTVLIQSALDAFDGDALGVGPEKLRIEIDPMRAIGAQEASDRQLGLLQMSRGGELTVNGGNSRELWNSWSMRFALVTGNVSAAPTHESSVARWVTWSVVLPVDEHRSHQIDIQV